jgi:hypothetical protein
MLPKEALSLALTPTFSLACSELGVRRGEIADGSGTAWTPRAWNVNINKVSVRSKRTRVVP